MELVFGFWLTATIIFTVIGLWFSIMGIIFYDGYPDDRYALKIYALIFVTGWAWPLWLTYGAYIIGRKGIKIIRDEI